MNRALSLQLATGKLEIEGVGARAAKAEKQLALLQKKHSELIATHAKTKTTIRELRTTKVELEHACVKGKTELACAEGRGVKLAVQCRAVEREVAEAAGKLETVNTQAKDFESRVVILYEVSKARELVLFFFSYVVLTFLCLFSQCRHYRMGRQNGRR
jgi:hypothetical protein